jgi:hypothetical protein
MQRGRKRGGVYTQGCNDHFVKPTKVIISSHEKEGIRKAYIEFPVF